MLAVLSILCTKQSAEVDLNNSDNLLKLGQRSTFYIETEMHVGRYMKVIQITYLRDTILTYKA